MFHRDIDVSLIYDEDTLVVVQLDGVRYERVVRLHYENMYHASIFVSIPEGNTGSRNYLRLEATMHGNGLGKGGGKWFFKHYTF